MKPHVDRLRTTTLLENTSSRSGISAEWGLSIFIETDEICLLLDCGRNAATLGNALKLNCELKRIEAVVLSHGHNDHTGGLHSLLPHLKNDMPIVAHPAVWQEKYVKSSGGSYRFAGIPHRRSTLESLGARFRLSAEPVSLSENVMATGAIPLKTDFEKPWKRLFIRKNDAWTVDLVPDDQSVLIRTPHGLVIISGCAHAGIVNTIHHCRDLSGVDRIHAVLGGTHLMDASAERIEKTTQALDALAIDKIGVSHCTGVPAILHLAQTFGGRFFVNHAGTVTDFV